MCRGTKFDTFDPVRTDARTPELVSRHKNIQHYVIFKITVPIETVDPILPSLRNLKYLKKIFLIMSSLPFPRSFQVQLREAVAEKHYVQLRVRLQQHYALRKKLFQCWQG